MGSWRDFVAAKGGGGSGGKKAKLGGVKPPKSKTVDEEKRYIQRPTGEQYRPPPLKRG